MLVAIIFIISSTIYLYFDLFKQNGKDPLHAFVPILNFYTVCTMVSAMWVFRIYIVALCGAIILGIMAMTVLPVVAMAAAICILTVLIAKIIVYIRLYLSKLYDLKSVVLLIILDTWRILVV